MASKAYLFFWIGLNIVLSIIVFSGLIIYIRNVQLDCIRARRPRGVILSSIGIFLGLLVDRTLLILWEDPDFSILKPKRWTAVNYIFFCTFAIGTLYIILYRAILLWYNINYTLAMQNASWRIKLSKNEPNWFLSPKNKKHWGNEYFVGKILFIIWFITSIPGIIYGYINGADGISRNILGVASLIPGISVLILWQKVPSLNDIFKIRFEMKILSIITFFMILIWIGIAIIGGITKLDRNSKLGIFLFLEYPGIGFFFVGLSQTWIVIINLKNEIKNNKKNINLIPKTSNNKHNDDDNIVIAMTLANRKSLHKDDQKNINEITLKDIIESKLGFMEFMRHLSLEYSFEVSYIFFIYIYLSDIYLLLIYL